MDQPSVRHALDGIKSSNSWTLDQQVSICEIPAPDFKEQARAAEFKKRLVALGYPNTRIDTAGNVIAERAGTGNGPTVMLAGHLDTVFPEGTDVRVKREGDRFAAPGIGDDCRGLAVVLAVARALNEGQVKTNGKVILVGNVGEEGEGNLRGVRELLTSGYKGKVDYFISVDGLGLHVTDRAVGSKRYDVKFKGPGGHSYGAFGMPSAIHAMGRAIALISDVQVPASPKTTYTVGIVKGGTSVNSIAGDASMEVDMRSESLREPRHGRSANQARHRGGRGGRERAVAEVAGEDHREVRHHRHPADRRQGADRRFADRAHRARRGESAWRRADADRCIEHRLEPADEPGHSRDHDRGRRLGFGRAFAHRERSTTRPTGIRDRSGRC